MKKVFIVFLALIAVFSCTAFAAVPDPTVYANKTTHEEQYQAAKDFLHQNSEAEFTLEDPICQKKFGVPNTAVRDRSIG